jgi:amidase
VAACQRDGLKGARIGVPRSSIIEKPGKAEAIRAFNKSLDLLRSLGAEIVEHADYLDYEDDIWTEDAKIVYALDFKTSVRKYFAGLEHNPHDIKDLNDLIRYTKQAPEEGYPSRDVARWEEAAAVPYEDNTSEYFKQVYDRHVWTSTVGSITGAIERFNLDALVTLTDYGNHPAGPAGLPVVSVPLGFQSPDVDIVIGRGGLRERVPQAP